MACDRSCVEGVRVWEQSYYEITPRITYSLYHIIFASSFSPSEEESTDEAAVVVDETLQEEFFAKVLGQLLSINHFFKKEESRLQFSLSELEDKVLDVMG